jgi:hypothetical protein
MVALGEAGRVGVFALGGAVVAPAEDADAVRRVWNGLGEDAVVVLLTERAAAALDSAEREGRAARRDAVLRVVMPS